MIAFPNVSRVAFSVFNIDIYWYALAYIVGILLGYFYAVKVSALLKTNFSKQELERFISFAVAGIILGGRFGHICFFEPDYYISNPAKIFAIREGGMSFHGGLIGVVSACALFCYINKKRFLELTDLAAASAPIGLFLGRLANFINVEVVGKVTSVPWGVVFPEAGPLPRHPSQIYEALLEGAALFILLLLTVKKYSKQKYNVGTLSSIFCIYYAVFRFLVEFVREPEEDFNLVTATYTGLTIGQWLCLPLAIYGMRLYFKTKQ
ncbi:MAG: prolipoprotein diacylglyceryl transferase [Holosporales bacterium]|jgi:phosphatidylglycerol:prolipoprotein diacylglycerol transferase|nr:prolipoprotein diacylglyceryl transferase [Holosporales bacterium]